MLLSNSVSQIEKPCNTITSFLTISHKPSESVVFHQPSRDLMRRRLHWCAHFVCQNVRWIDKMASHHLFRAERFSSVQPLPCFRPHFDEQLPRTLCATVSAPCRPVPIRPSQQTGGGARQFHRARGGTPRVSPLLSLPLSLDRQSPNGRASRAAE